MNVLDFAEQHLSLSKNDISRKTGLTLDEIEYFHFHAMPWVCQNDLLLLLNSDEKAYDNWLIHGTHGEHIQQWTDLLMLWTVPTALTIDDNIRLALPIAIQHIKKTGIHLADIGASVNRNGAFLHTYHFMILLSHLLQAYQQFFQQYQEALSMLSPNPDYVHHDTMKMKHLMSSLLPTTLLMIGEKGWRELDLSSSDCLSQLTG